MSIPGKQHRVAVITGAAQGIGAATAALFLEQGTRVARLDKLPEAKANPLPNDESHLYVQCDVSRADQVGQAFEHVENRFGHLDVLVNNAGIQHYGTVLETSEEAWDRVMAVNLKGAFLCARQALRAMTRQGLGVVVNVASVQGMVSQARVAAYATSKTALLGLTRSIAIDYAPGIRCVAVCPGSVDTPMLRWGVEQAHDPVAIMQECRDMHLLKRIAQPEEVAHLIAYLASDRAGFITGQAFRIDGGLGIRIEGAAPTPE